jgi:hypothetical protein
LDYVISAYPIPKVHPCIFTHLLEKLSTPADEWGGRDGFRRNSYYLCGTWGFPEE